jgi:hypothetical protein
MKQIFLTRGRRLALVASLALAVAAGALTSSGWAHRAHVSAPAPSTAGLNKQYTACLQANGATWTPIANSGGMYRVDIPAAANARCAALDLAREAAGDGNAAVANWIASIQSVSPDFWGCLGAAGYHVPGGTGQQSDYASANFMSTARSCAANVGVSLPPGP